MAKQISRIEIVQADPFKDIHDSAAKTETKIVVLKAALEAINTAIDKNVKTASKLKGTGLGIDPSSIKNQKEYVKWLNETSRVTKENSNSIQSKTRVTKALTIEEAKLKEELRQANLESRQVAKLKLAEEGSVKKLQAKLAILIREWDKLTEAERKNTDRGKRLKTGIDQTTASVTKLEQATGRHQRNVGNYGSALDGLKGKFRSLIGFAGQLGLAFGGAILLRNAIGTVVTFDAALADLSAITGATGKDLDFFRKKSIELGKDVKGGASAVVEAYKLIASAKPELLENADALNKVTESAILLARASGMELPDAATALTDAMNQFGVGADQASKFVDVLAAGAKFGSAEIPQITQALLKFGAVAKTTNVSIQESTGLIEALAEKGLKGAEAGTALRNVMLKLSAPDALPKEAQEMMEALGVNFDDLKDKSKPFSERLEALKPLLNDNAALIKVFGTENAVAATTLLSTTDRIKELTASVDENGVALDQADARSKTITEAFNRLKETFNGMILSFANGSNAAGGVVTSMDFLAKNLSSIIKAVFKLVVAFTAFKVILAGLNFKDKIKDLIQYNKAVKASGEISVDAGKSSKAFGAILKSIVIVAIIAALYELAQAFYDVASGAKRAREAQERFNNSVADSDKKASERISSRQKALQDQIAEEERLLAIALSTEKNEKKRGALELRSLKTKEQLIKATKAEIVEDIKKVDARKILLKQNIEEAKQNQSRLLLQKGITAKRKEDLTYAQLQALLGVTYLDEFQKYNDIIDQNTANLAGANTKIIQYRNELSETTGVIDDASAATEVFTNTTDKDVKAKDKLNTVLAKQNEYLSEQTGLLETLDEQRRRAEVRGVQTDIDTQIANLAKVARETGELDVDILESTIAKKFELERAHVLERERFEINAITEKYRIDAALARQSLKDERDKLLEQKDLTPTARLDIEKNYQTELTKLEQDELQRAADLELQIRIIKGASNEELIELEKAHNDEINAVNDELINAQIEHATKLNDVVKNAAKENFEEEKKWIDLTEELFAKNIDKKIALVEKEMEAHRKASDELQRLAEEGNIQASQSIAEEERLANEAALKKEQLEQRKRQLQMIAAFIKSYLNALDEGKTPGQALGQAASSEALLSAAIEGLPVFFEGADRVSDALGAPDLPGRDGHIIRVDGDERILNPSQNQAIGSMTNDEVVRRIQMSKIAEASGNIAPSGWDNAPLLASLNGLSKDMKAVKKAIEDKPETDWQIDKITSEVLQLTKRKREGNSITYNRYRQE